MSGEDKKRKAKGEEDGNKKHRTTTPKKTSQSPTQSPAAQTKPVIVEQKLTIPGFEEIKDGVVWRDGHVDFEQSVARLSTFVDKYIKHTPQYFYELLSQIFNCKCFLKLENLQIFGDIYVRNCFGAIVGNYFNQKNRIKTEFSETPGLVIVMNPELEHHLLDGIALTALHLKFDVIIYVAPGNLSLLQCVQLYTCHQKGAKVIFHKGDVASCAVRANKHAEDLRMVYIEHKFTPQFGMLGAATVAYEMLHETTSLDTIVIPLRLYTVGWSYVSGISLYCKMVKPSIRVIVVQMTEDIALGDSSVISKEDRQSLFPDRSEFGWLSLVQESNILRNVFDAFDARNLGKFSASDLENVISQMGGDPKRFPPQLPGTLSLTEFMKKVDKERVKMQNAVWEQNKNFLDFLSLENLKAKKLIDDVVEVSEDQAVVSFIKCLEYTHTLTNGKGSIALAGLFSGKVQIKPDENLAVLIMGGFVDVIDFQTLFDYGLDLIGQNFEIELDLPDNATALSNVLKVISDLKVSVYEILMDRNGESLRQYHVRTRIQCRSRNFDQQQDAITAITKMGYTCKNNRSPSATPPPKITDTSLPLSSPLSSLPLSSPLTDLMTNNINSFMSSPMITSTKPSSSHPPPASPPSSNSNGNGSSADTKTKIAPPRKMESVTPDTIREAHERIKDNLNSTPIYLSQIYSKLCKSKVYLMLENIQKTGSFKIRGSSNMVLKAVEESGTLPKGLVAASAGNHAQGVALVSKKVGLPCCIVCPEYAPESKLQWTRNYGAEVVKHGNSLEAAAKRAEQICEQRGWLMVRPFNDVDVIEGQGTMGCEIYNQIPDIDTVVVNVGGGGMIAGIALYLKGVNPNIRIVGVQSANVAPLADFKTTHTLRYIEPAMLTLADGTNVKLPGGVHTKLLDELVDEYVTVSENEIASTIVHLMENSRTLSEGAGCLGLAALLHHKISVRKDEKVCVVLCGGNIDMSTLKQVYEYGLRSLGRLFTIHVSTWDYPGNLAKIIGLAAKAELVVREIRHIRGKGDINWNEVTISLAFYSNSFDHQVLFLNLLIEENLFPKLIGRKYIKEHDTIYGSVDKAMEKKHQEMQKKHTEHQEKFMEWYRQQYSTVM